LDHIFLKKFLILVGIFVYVRMYYNLFYGTALYIGLASARDFGMTRKKQPINRIPRIGV